MNLKNGKSWETSERKKEITNLKKSISRYQTLLTFFQLICTALIIVVVAQAWKIAPSISAKESLELIDTIQPFLFYSIIGLFCALLSSISQNKSLKRLIHLLENKITHKQEIDEINTWLDASNEAKINQK